MTDELIDYGPDSYITEFVSGGPKNYTYKIHSTKDNKNYFVTKVKGFTLSSATSSKLNFHSLRKVVRHFVKLEANDSKTIYFQQIRRLPNHKIVTTDTSKNYRVVYNKRVLKRNYKTVPYGYRLKRHRDEEAS